MAGAKTPIGERNYSSRPCQYCGTVFKRTHPRQKYCSDQCCIDDVNKRRRERYSALPPEKKKVEHKKRRQWYRQNKNAHRAKAQEYYAKHRDRLLRLKREAWHRNKAENNRKQMEFYNDYEFDGNRSLALKRDGYQCRICGRSDLRLNVHHLDGRGLNVPREQRNNDLSNLITLCASCHAKLHDSLNLRDAH